jgi:hypothetical protein
LGPLVGLPLSPNFGNGPEGLCPIVRGFILQAYQQFARQSGEQESQFVLIKKSIKSPNEIICLASPFISYWSGLHKQEDNQDLEDGAQALKEAAIHIHHQQTAGASVPGLAMLL